MTMLDEHGTAWGDHVDGGLSEWLDDCSHRGGPCPHCASTDTLVRHRAASARGLPLHRHSVTACLDCSKWSVTCHAEVETPELVAWQ